MRRSFAAIVGGYIAYAFLMGFTVLVLITLAATQFGPAAGTTRTTGAMAVEIVYSVLFAMFGGYVAALIARRAEVAHAAILAAVILLISVITVMGTREPAPLWYNATLTLLSAAGVIVGGMLRARQTTTVVI
jgi:hypothetical protein